jgi:parvulin-like peptidyl-prolyl isomerase
MIDKAGEKTSERQGGWSGMAQVNPRRSLILFAAGAILGLVIAGIGLFTAAGTQASGIPAEDVALINGRHVLRSDFIAQTQVETTLPFDQTTKEQRLKVLNEMVDEELLVQRGLEVDLAASDPDVRAAEVAGVQLQVDADVLAEQPSDEQLQAYFTAHKDKYSAEGIMALRDLIFRPDEALSPEQAAAKAKEAGDAFRKGKDSDDIAATFGLKDSGKLERGDLFDFAVKIKLSPALYAAAKALSTRQAAGPIVEAGFVHLILMEKHDPGLVRSFAQARDAVMQDYKKEEQTRVETANLKYLKSKADIRLAPEYR